MSDVSHYLSLPYTKVLKRDDEGDIIATIAELDGCMAHGSDEAEALQNLREAQAAWLEAAIAAGQDPPVPEIEEDLPSGKFVVRFPRWLHQKLNKLAQKDDVSLNQLMIVAATEHVTRREARVEARMARMAAMDPSAWRSTSSEWRPEHPGSADMGEYLQKIKERKAITGDEHHRHVRSGLPRVRKG